MDNDKANLLIVDDHPANLMALEAVLDDLGTNVFKAASGEEGLRLLLEQDFAVVLLDVQMAPGLDGFETAKLIRSRERSRHTPIIFLTAHDEGPSVELAYALGAVDYLVKPVPPVILRAKVSGFVQLFEKTEQVKRQAEQLRQIEHREFQRQLAEQASAAVSRDISDLKRAEEALRVSEERLRSLSDNLPHGAVYQVVIEPEGKKRFGYISAGVEGLFGVTPKEVQDDATALYGLIHEEDGPRVLAEEEEAGRNLASFNCEFRSWTRSGAVRWVHCRSAPRRLPSGQMVWEGIVLDVTARKKAEEELRQADRLKQTITDNATTSIFMEDSQGRCTFMNPAAEAMTGYTFKELEGAMVHEKVHRSHPDGRPYPMSECLICQSLALLRDLRGHEDLFVRKDGTFVPVMCNASPILSDGILAGIVLEVRDITEEKRALEALKEADKRKDEFLAMLAHELRNPLAPIRNAVQVFRLLGPADPNLQQARDMIDRQVGHMTHLVDDLLDVSRITQGKITLQKDRIDLVTVVARAVEECSPLIDARRHELTVTLPPQPAWVEGDATRLVQVLANLLNNAAKYSEEGGRIWLTVETDQNEAVVRVRDNGMGIPADLLPQVFDLFTQGDRSLARSEGGLGIGLTLVKRLIDLHDGTVEACSQGLGKGSEFAVRLPIPKTSLGAVRDEDELAHRQPVLPRRVLIVDDNVDAGESLGMLLRIAKHDVRIAHDGPTALQLAEAFQPEVVFLDIGLPRMDGHEVARRLRAQAGTKNALLVAITGYGQEDDRRKTQEAGFDAHLVKPADPAVLHQLLARP